jgi:preprotein translocase subunit SecY
MSLPAYFALTVLPLTAGTTSLMWMAEEITRTGIGQGISVVISLSIVGAYASALRAIVPRVLAGTVPAGVLAAIGAALLLQTALAVLVVEGVRKVPIVFFQLQGGAGGAPGAATALRDDHIPFRVNPQGIQPVLFAVILLDGMPWALSAIGVASLSAVISPTRPLYYVLYFAVVFAFSFLDLEDTPAEVAEYILKVGARVPGVRPGDATVAYMRATQRNARAWGGLMLGVLSTASMLADKWMHSAFGKSVGFTSMLIIVRARAHMCCLPSAGYCRMTDAAAAVCAPAAQTGTILQMRRQVRAYSQKPALDKVLAQL